MCARERERGTKEEKQMREREKVTLSLWQREHGSAHIFGRLQEPVAS